MPAKITVFNDGPIKVEGDQEVVDMNGNALSDPNQPTFLCRCGNSKNAPFCDGSHKQANFKSTVQGKNA
jgi:CDGSH-type Zn-finger protein